MPGSPAEVGELRRMKLAAEGIAFLCEITLPTFFEVIPDLGNFAAPR